MERTSSAMLKHIKTWLFPLPQYNILKLTQTELSKNRQTRYCNVSHSSTCYLWPHQQRFQWTSLKDKFSIHALKIDPVSQVSVQDLEYYQCNATMPSSAQRDWQHNQIHSIKASWFKPMLKERRYYIKSLSSNDFFSILDFLERNRVRCFKCYTGH